MRIQTLILYIVCSSLMSCTSKGTSAISFNPKTVSIGYVNVGDSRSGSVIIKNVGNSDVQIESLTSGCSCTSLRISEKLIKVGASAKIAFTFHPATDNPIGKFSMPVLVKSNTKNLLDEFSIVGIVTSSK